MNDLIVQVSKGYRTVIPAKTFIGNDGENLQTKLIFTFLDEFIDGVGRLEVLIDDEKSYIPLVKENESYYLPIKNVMTKVGNIELQLVITEAENEFGIPLYKSDIFKLYCKDSINAVDEAPEGYDLWIDIANAKIIEIDEKIDEVNQAIIETNNLNITLSKSEGITTVTLTKKDGSREIIRIYDGETGNGIESITKTGTSGLVDTYTITYTDGTTTTFDVTNGEDGTDGRGIESITKTSTVGYVDTYTITYTDGTTTTFEVTNGEVSQAELDETNRKVEQAMMVYNALPKVTDEDTEISLNGTANTPMQLELNASELEQVTTTGKNKLNYTLETLKTLNTSGTWTNNEYTWNGITFTVNEDLTIIVSGSASSSSYLLLVETPDLVSGTEYKLNGCKSGGNVQTYSLRMYEGTSYISQIGNDYTFTFSNQNNIRINIFGGSSVNKVLFKPMIRLSSVTDDTYEKYTGGIPQPNPDYPSEVQVIMGNNTLSICNRNLFDGQYEVGYIDIDTGALMGFSNVRTKNYTRILPNTQYSISGAISRNTYAIYYNKDKAYISYQQIKSSSKTGTFTTPNNSNLYYIKWYDAVSTGDVPEWQLEFGNESTTYVAHQEQVLPLNLGLKNKFDNNYEVATQYYTDGNQGTGFYNLNNDIISTNKNVNDNGRKFLNKNSLEAKSYTLSGDISFSNNTNTRLYYSIRDLGTQTDIIGGTRILIGANTGSFVITFTLTSASNNICFSLQPESSADGTISLSNIQLVEGNIPQYISDNPIEYCKIGTYEDEFEHDGDKWYINKSIGKTILNGNENWSNPSSLYFQFTHSISNVIAFVDNPSTNGYCNLFIPRTRYFVINNNDGKDLSINITDTYVAIKYNQYNGNLDNFKNWLSSHNVILYYQLSTPTREEITDTTLISQLNAIEQAVSYDEQTNISQTNTGLPFRIKASAVRSLVNIFDIISGGA